MSFFSSFFDDNTFSYMKDIYTNNIIPGKEIKTSLGLISYTKKGIGGNIIDEIDNCFKNFLKLAKDKGADAIINARIVTGTYQQQGSGWNATYLIIYGEAVKFK